VAYNKQKGDLKLMGIETLLQHASNDKPAKLASEFDSIMKEKILEKISELKDEIVSNVFEAKEEEEDDDEDDDDDDMDEEFDSDDDDDEDMDENVAGKKRSAAQRVAAGRERKKKDAKKIKKNKKLKRVRKTAAFKVKVKKREKLNVGKKARTARRREQER